MKLDATGLRRVGRPQRMMVRVVEGQGGFSVLIRRRFSQTRFGAITRVVVLIRPILYRGRLLDETLQTRWIGPHFLFRSGCTTH